MFYKDIVNKFFSIIIIVFFNFASFAEVSSDDSNLPEGFVYLKDIDPTIIVKMKYYDNDNFTGLRVAGYNKPQAILTLEAAKSLKKVQNDLMMKKYSLVVYDAYRPMKAVEQFINWVYDLSNQSTKSKFYPNVEKAELVNLGYIAEKSDHSRGSSVDVTIISVDKELTPQNEIKRILGDGSEILFLDDGSIDMGSSFNQFDEVSQHNCPKNTTLGDINRRLLKSTMLKYGFVAYEKEWWHYTLAKEPFPDTDFDFDIE
jgi:D-alanyl-D-alanine dipeptidase